MPLIEEEDHIVSYAAYGEVELRTIHHKNNGSAMLSVIDVHFNERAIAPVHACTNTEEVVYVLEGEFKFSYNGAKGKLKKGDCICYPTGVSRSYECLGSSGRLLFISPHPKPYWRRKPDRSIEGGNRETKREFRGHVCKASDPGYHLKGVKRHTFCSPKIGARSTFASEIIIEPDAVVPIHHHPKDDVSLICLEGNIVFKYGKESLDVGEGTTLLVEAGKKHGVKNKSLDDVRFLEIYPTDEPEYVYTYPKGLDKSNFLQLHPSKVKQIEDKQKK